MVESTALPCLIMPKTKLARSVRFVVTCSMKTLIAFVFTGAAVAFLSSCVPSNPAFRYDRKVFEQSEVDDSYVTPKPRQTLPDKRNWRR